LILELELELEFLIVLGEDVWRVMKYREYWRDFGEGHRDGMDLKERG